MYRITQCLSVGPFAGAERAEALRAAGVTHVLNVSEGASGVCAGGGSFAEVAWVPLEDHRRLPFARAAEVLDTLHRLASAPGAHVYVHCMAGVLRSPTVLWLYLVACGLSARDARELIETRSPDAVAGHFRMVDDEHVLFAQQHGLAHFFPLPRGEVIVPFPLPEERQ